MYYQCTCTGRVEVTKNNQHQFNNAPVGTVFFRLVSDQDGIQVLDRLTLKGLMETGDVSVINLKLDSAGKIIQNKQLDKIIEYMRNEIINGGLMLVPGEAIYDQNEEEILSFLKRNPEYKLNDIEAIVDDLANEIEASGKKVYTCGFSDMEGGGSMSNFCYSCNISSILKALESCTYDTCEALQWRLPEDKENQDEDERIIARSTEKLMKDPKITNVKLFACDVLELDASYDHNKYELSLYMNKNTRNILAGLVSKMTLEEKLQAMHEKMLTLETLEDIKAMQSNDIKKLFTDAVNNSKNEEECNRSYHRAFGISDEIATRGKTEYYTTDQWREEHYAVLKIIDRLRTKNAKALTELNNEYIGVKINNMGIKVGMTYNTLNKHRANILILSPWDPDGLDSLFE